MRRPLFVSFALIAAVGCDLLAAGTESPIQRTKNERNDSTIQFFHQAALSLTIDAKGAHFRTRRDGPKFVLMDPRTPENYKNQVFHFQYEFTLSRPGEVFSSPDHHIRSVFTVKSITATELVLDYEFSFDHRSFGKNLITIDEGEITLKPFGSPKV